MSEWKQVIEKDGLLVKGFERLTSAGRRRFYAEVLDGKRVLTRMRGNTASQLINRLTKPSWEITCVCGWSTGHYDEQRTAEIAYQAHWHGEHEGKDWKEVVAEAEAKEVAE